jgi:hypothetical protein
MLEINQDVLLGNRIIEDVWRVNITVEITSTV